MDFYFKTNSETNEFIKKYLQMNHPPLNTERNAVLIENNWKEINVDLYKPNVSEYAINVYIGAYMAGKENYWRFKSTLYWYICADKIKLLSGHLCSNDSRHNPARLEAHHNSYDNHGREIQHINEAMEHKCRFEIVCLCNSCHAYIHHKEEGKKINGSIYQNQIEINDLGIVLKDVMTLDHYKKEISLLPDINKKDYSIENTIIRQRIIAVELEKLIQQIDKTKFRLIL